MSVKSPCTVDWNGMVGDEIVRFCGECKRNVYNLSAMSSEQAEAFIETRAGEACVRFYQRADGTLVTRDCNGGAQRRNQAKIALGAAAMAVAGAALALAPRPDASCGTEGARVLAPPPERAVMGEMAVEPAPPPAPPRVEPVMGKMRVAPSASARR